jgi:hypothetical protein
VRMELVMAGEAPLATAAHLGFQSGSTSLTIDASRLLFACPLDLAGMVAIAHAVSESAVPVTLHMPRDQGVASYLQRLDVVRLMPSRIRVVGRVPPDVRTDQAHRLLEVTRLTPDNEDDVAERVGRLVTAHFRDTDAGAGRRAYAACGELLANAAEHGASPAGAFVAVQTYTGQSGGVARLEMAVCDTGIGVLEHLRRNVRYAHLNNDAAALEKAVLMGISGVSDDRGNGLHDLVEFSRRHGTTRLHIRSGDAEIAVLGTPGGVTREVRPRVDRTPGTWAWLTHHLDADGATMVQSEQ